LTVILLFAVLKRYFFVSNELPKDRERDTRGAAF